jgi:hypothetical protein
MVGSVGIEPTSVNKTLGFKLFTAGSIRPMESDGGLGRN